MPDFLINDANFYISKTREAALNTDETAGANFLRVLTQQPTFILPQFEFTSDAGKPGNGHEFETYACPTYVTHPAFSLTDDVNVSYFGRLALRAVGGTVTTAQQEATAAYKHSAKQLLASTSLQLPSSTLISLLGGASFRVAGMVVDRFRLSQNRADVPQCAVDLIGTGDFTTPHGVTSLPATASILQCLDGNQSAVSWTDRVGAQNFSGAGCALRSWFVEIANNTRLNDRCPGDPVVTVVEGAVEETFAYVQKLKHGARTVTAQIVITLDSTIPDWLTYGTNDVLTDVTFRAQGEIIETIYRNSLGIILSKGRITSIDPIENEGDACLAINLTGVWDGTDATVATVEVINEETSAFV
jgi:hypothetical protein